MPTYNTSNILEYWVNELSSLLSVLSVAKNSKKGMANQGGLNRLAAVSRLPIRTSVEKAPTSGMRRGEKVGAKWGALLRSAHLLSEHFSR